MIEEFDAEMKAEGQHNWREELIKDVGRLSFNDTSLEEMLNRKMPCLYSEACD